MIRIDLSKKEVIEDLLSELNGLEIPCTLAIYDRVFRIDTKEELRMFIYGAEVGNFIALDRKEGKL